MATVITRYFDSADQALSVKGDLLYDKGFPFYDLSLYDSTDRLLEKLTGNGVAPETAKAYESRMASGGAILLVRATYKPLGAARIAREVMAEMGAVDMGDLVQDIYVKEDRSRRLSVFTDHRLFLTRPWDPSKKNHYMADWPIPLISKRKPYTGSLLSSPHARMANWPIPLLSKRKPYTGSIIRPHARMANFPIPLLSQRKPYTKSIFPRHARMANFPIPLLSKRKPYTGSLFPRHQRMATWPFPLLINGKTGTNALMPGGPRMANFPISLLSDRKPFTGSIIPRHARMANFPIPLLSKRKPYSASAFPRHARMADFPIPLVVRREDSQRDDGTRRPGFSFSKLLGWPTIIRR